MKNILGMCVAAVSVLFCVLMTGYKLGRGAEARAGKASLAPVAIWNTNRELVVQLAGLNRWAAGAVTNAWEEGYRVVFEEPPGRTVERIAAVSPSSSASAIFSNAATVAEITMPLVIATTNLKSVVEISTNGVVTVDVRALVEWHVKKRLEAKP